MEKILIIDDDGGVRTLLDKVVSQLGFESFTAEDGPEGLDIARKESLFAVFTDLMMPSMDGIEVLRRLKDLDPDLPVIIVTAFGTIETAVKAMKLGADDFILKPFPMQQIEVVTSRIRRRGAIRRENQSLKELLKRGSGTFEMVGEDPSILKIHELVQKVAPADTTVLIEGESGTGKELVARAIHRNSGRPAEKYVSINCASFAESLLDSEIFGHEAGAFTGAKGKKNGLIEVAGEGTLLLDEIAETSPALQAKLLRAIQEKSFFRVGGTRPVKVDVRFVASTNRNLAVEVRDGRFRRDLYYRLSVFPIRLPPLRNRKTDIPLLVDTFVERFAGKKDTSPVVTEEVMEQFMGYSWPGNIRELENVIERAVILSGGDVIRVAHIPHEITDRPDLDVPGMDFADMTLRRAREKVEEMYLCEVLKRFGGNVSRSSEHAGIGRGTFHEKLKRYGIDALEFRRRVK
jgi:two-component system NtrC family response regulator